MVFVTKMWTHVLRCVSVWGGAEAEALRCRLSATAAVHSGEWAMSDVGSAGRGLLTGKQ